MPDRFVLDHAAFNSALKNKGYRSYSELASVLGLHRNTVGNYLRDGFSALPDALSKLLLALGLDGTALVPYPVKVDATDVIEPVVDLLDQLVRKMPDSAFILFGSRARQKYKKFSDYDIGVYRTQKIEFALFSSLLDIVAEWNEQQLTTVQLVNLTVAEDGFLMAIREDAKFVAGSAKAWVNFYSAAYGIQ